MVYFFYCTRCSKLETLKGGPKEVKFNLDCTSCPKLKSLEGASAKIGKLVSNLTE